MQLKVDNERTKVLYEFLNGTGNCKLVDGRNTDEL